MADQFTKTYVLPSEKRYVESQVEQNISQTNADIKSLIAAHNALVTEYNTLSAAVIAAGVTVGALTTVVTELTDVVGIAPTGIIATSTDLITLTGIALDSFLNNMVIGTEIIAAAANPTDTILIVVTKALTGLDSNKIAITVTLNDGTNNPVDAIASTGTVDGVAYVADLAGVAGDSITIEITDAGAAVASAATIDGVDYVADLAGVAGDYINIVITDAGEAGSTTVVVTGAGTTGDHWVITCDTDVAAASQQDVRDAINGDATAGALVTGSSGSADAASATVTGSTPLASGADAGATAVDVTVNAITVDIDVSVGTQADVATAINEDAQTLVTASGGSAVAGSATITAATNLAGGADATTAAVGLTTAQLALAIVGGVSGTYGGIVCTITDAGGWLAHITAASNGTTALANSGEGDSTYCIMNGGRKAS